ncbi:Membrane associated serine protease, rhomboid family [Stigmatella aurantiaca]|uniref:Membrane associated serine protease, rhomboid family n=1 Tax=Stigmatella aurantiaca TaxID=41 RepID=A0A1H7YP26_STIAU|nr:rhomboid family intramembrane serine protease [Stigmatella aurantiaca]SEM47058.1 Membrane associated serine protease, rhomboid family [Stigmatella aurantiaca]
MFPISDDNPTLRTPVMTYGLLGVIVAVWALVQGAGFNTVALASSVCNWGMVPGELSGRAQLGFAVPLGEGLACVVDNEPFNWLTPLTSMFLHGGWGHILGNCLFFWVFGNNVEDSMGRGRFLVFYLLCGLVAAGAHVLVDPGSPVPTVGASGAISGVLGAYLVLYPRVRVKLLVPLFIFLTFISLPAWVVLIYWFVLQVITGLPQLMTLRPEVSGGVAVWAHIGGFVAGMVLIKLFENRSYTDRRTSWRHRLHPDHP